MGERTLGQVGYEAYAEVTRWKSLATGQDLPQWSSLRPDIQAAWERAAIAIKSSTRGDQPNPIDNDCG